MLPAPSTRLPAGGGLAGTVIAAAVMVLALSVLAAALSDDSGVGGGSAAPPAPWLFSLDAEAEASRLASKLGFEPSDAEDYYLVYMSGRMVRFTAGDLGVSGLEPGLVAFGAYVPGRGWVPLPYRAYDYTYTVSNTVYDVLREGKLRNSTVVEVKLPTMPPADVDPSTSPPPFARGAKAIRIEIRGANNAVAVIYAFVGVEGGYVGRQASFTLYPTPSGLPLLEQPWLALKAVRAGLYDEARGVAVAFIVDPIVPGEGGYKVSLGPVPSVPNGGGGGGIDASPALIEVRAAVGEHLLGEAGRLEGPEGVLYIPVHVKPPGVGEGLYWSFTAFKLVASYIAVDPPAVLEVNVTVAETGDTVYSGVLEGWEPRGAVEVPMAYYGVDGLDLMESFTLIVEWRRPDISAAAFNLTIAPVVVKYYASPNYTLLPSPEIDAVVSLGFLPASASLTLTPSRPMAALAFPAPAPFAGGYYIGVADSVQEYYYIMNYRVNPEGSGPLLVEWYLDGKLLCAHYIKYSSSVTCSFTLDPAFVASLALEEGEPVVLFAAKSLEPLVSDVEVTVTVVPAGGRQAVLRPLVPIYAGAGYMLTASAPNQHEAWGNSGEYYLRFQAFRASAALGVGARHLSPGALAAYFFTEGPEADINCAGPSSNLFIERLLVVAISSEDEYYSVRFNGSLWGHFSVDNKVDRVWIEVRFDPNAVFVSRVEVEERGPGGVALTLPEIPPPASLIISLLAPKAAGAALAVYDAVSWTLDMLTLAASAGYDYTVDNRRGVATIEYYGGPLASLEEATVRVGLRVTYRECGVHAFNWATGVVYRDGVAPLEVSVAGTVERPVR